jgi:hypothetical protein
MSPDSESTIRTQAELTRAQIYIARADALVNLLTFLLVASACFHIITFVYILLK